jgi:hypothetical protein
MNEVEKTMIEIAYDSWLFAVATHQDNELVAHHAKRFKYLIDWIGIALEIETERKEK